MRPYWELKVAEVGSNYYKVKYRSVPIKRCLMEETKSKCAYCESKVGHNTPGDVEHKVPVSVQEIGRFAWDNLTIACTECNRRKCDYFDRAKPFADPYAHDVETNFIHVGPCVFPKPGDETAEVTVRVLELGEVDRRQQLFSRKVTVIKAVQNLMARIVEAKSGPLQELLIADLRAMAEPVAEYSAMVRAILQTIRGPWD